MEKEKPEQKNITQSIGLHVVADINEIPNFILNDPKKRNKLMNDIATGTVFVESNVLDKLCESNSFIK